MESGLVSWRELALAHPEPDCAQGTRTYRLPLGCMDVGASPFAPAGTALHVHTHVLIYAAHLCTHTPTRTPGIYMNT